METIVSLPHLEKSSWKQLYHFLSWRNRKGNNCDAATAGEIWRYDTTCIGSEGEREGEEGAGDMA